MERVAAWTCDRERTDLTQQGENSMQIIFWINTVLIIVTAAITYLTSFVGLRDKITDEAHLRATVAIIRTLVLSMVTLTSFVNTAAYYQFQSPVALWIVTWLCTLTITDFLKPSRHTPQIINKTD